MHDERILARMTIRTDAPSAAIKVSPPGELGEWLKSILGNIELQLVLLIIPEAGLACFGSQADDAKQDDCISC